MFPVSLFFGLLDSLSWPVLLFLLVLGIAIILLISKIILFIVPAAIIAFAVWMISGSGTLAGVAFVAVAVLSILKR
jgi:hypothetical protein